MSTSDASASPPLAPTPQSVAHLLHSHLNLDPGHSASSSSNPASPNLTNGPLPPSYPKHVPSSLSPFQPAINRSIAAQPHSRSSTPLSIEQDGLAWPSVGTRLRKEETPESRERRLQRMSEAVATLLECVGEDPEREGLQATPMRMAKAMMFFTKGYEQSLKEVLNGAVFEEDHDEMVIVKNIDVFSLCEHHMVPFVGKVSIGYIPNGRVLGLSKLARISEMFSRRLQVQERLTKQIAFALMDTLQPQGVAVTMECSHMCMVMRGVEKPGSSTITSCMLGVFREDPKTREEFLRAKKLT
ncbi:hypothetical protein HK101_002907 [Irineochytrium annulatum]|nr:hypothetical protein HK101_002907 [Irineochytrium annulatum]